MEHYFSKWTNIWIEFIVSCARLPLDLEHTLEKIHQDTVTAVELLDVDVNRLASEIIEVEGDSLQDKMSELVTLFSKMDNMFNEERDQSCSKIDTACKDAISKVAAMEKHAATMLFSGAELDAMEFFNEHLGIDFQQHQSLKYLPVNELETPPSVHALSIRWTEVRTHFLSLWKEPVQHYLCKEREQWARISKIRKADVENACNTALHQNEVRLRRIRKDTYRLRTGS